MISIEKCRELIDDDREYTDEEIEKIRETLYGLAELVLEQYFKERKNGK